MRSVRLHRNHIVVIIVFVVLITAASYLFGVSSSKTKLYETNPAPVQEKVIKFEMDTVYDNPILGIAFSLPKDWKIEHNGSDDYFVSPDQKMDISITSFTKQYDTTMQKLADNAIDYLQSKITKTPMTIQNHPSLLTETTLKDGTSNIFYSSVYIDNVTTVTKDPKTNISKRVNSVIVLRLASHDKTKTAQAQSLFKQIVATITFINPTQY